MVMCGYTFALVKKISRGRKLNLPLSCRRILSYSKDIYFIFLIIYFKKSVYKIKEWNKSNNAKRLTNNMEKYYFKKYFFIYKITNNL